MQRVIKPSEIKRWFKIYGGKIGLLFLRRTRKIHVQEQWKRVIVTNYSTFILFFSVVKRKGWDILEKLRLFDILVVTNDNKGFSLE